MFKEKKSYFYFLLQMLLLIQKQLSYIAWRNISFWIPAITYSALNKKLLLQISKSPLFHIEKKDLKESFFLQFLKDDLGFCFLLQILQISCIWHPYKRPQ